MDTTEWLTQNIGRWQKSDGVGGYKLKRDLFSLPPLSPATSKISTTPFLMYFKKERKRKTHLLHYFGSFFNFNVTLDIIF